LCYSAITKNEILPFAGKWMEPEIIILNEISQAEKTKYHMFPLICRMEVFLVFLRFKFNWVSWFLLGYLNFQ
jgi:hypothetical protein